MEHFLDVPDGSEFRPIRTPATFCNEVIGPAPQPMKCGHGAEASPLSPQFVFEGMPHLRPRNLNQERNDERHATQAGQVEWLMQ